MASIGVNIAIVRNGAILLTLRDDFEVWCMPGGHLDPGETFAQAAVREAREETGLNVDLTCFVGSYSRANWAHGLYHIHLFTAKITNVELHLQPGETLDARFFPLDNLPDDLLVGNCHRIQDVADGLVGVVKTEIIHWPFPGLNRQSVYRMRDESGLSRTAFYKRHFSDLTPEQIIVEVPGRRIV